MPDQVRHDGVSLFNCRANHYLLPKRNFSITPGCIGKIPLNPPSRGASACAARAKGEEVGIPGLIENLQKLLACDGRRLWKNSAKSGFFKDHHETLG